MDERLRSGAEVPGAPARTDPLEVSLGHELVEKPQRLGTVEAGPLAYANDRPCVVGADQEDAACYGKSPGNRAFSIAPLRGFPLGLRRVLILVVGSRLS